MRPRYIYLIAVTGLIILLDSLFEPADKLVALLAAVIPVIAIGFWIRKIDPPTSKTPG